MRFPYGSDAEPARRFIAGYLERLQAEPILRRVGLQLSALAVLRVTDLGLEIAVDSRERVLRILPSAPAEPPEVAVSLTSSLLHDVLSGRTNIAVAYTLGKLRVEGNLAKLRQLYAFMGWAVDLYHDYLQDTQQTL